MSKKSTGSRRSTYLGSNQKPNLDYRQITRMKFSDLDWNSGKIILFQFFWTYHAKNLNYHILMDPHLYGYHYLTILWPIALIAGSHMLDGDFFLFFLNSFMNFYIA